MAHSPAPLPVGVAAPAVASPVDWGAILAGAVVASAIAFVLLAFGSAAGLSLGSAEPGEGVSLAWISIASGIWFIWVAVSAFAAGGYCAGRLRRVSGGVTPDEIETRDGAHGVVVWALGTLIAAVMAANGIGGLTGAAAGAAGTAASAVTQAAGDALGNDYGDLGASLLREGGGTPAARKIDAGQIGGILSAAAAGDGLSDTDRTYLTQTLAARTGLTPDEAGARIDEALAEAQEIRAAAVDAAETARVVAAIAAFVVAATLMAGAGAAWFGATAGGAHRDDGLPFRSLHRR